MVVQHNLTAMNSNRMLGITQTLQAKSSEKLSSGFRINRAADDAAGLSISEKMRKQINGLDTASTNAQDGVSAVQTAEGALTEVHSMLQRMNELAVQAANGTNSASDREAIQNEIKALETEIDRVADTTKFNETYLLKGDGEVEPKKVAAHDAGLLGKLDDNGDGTYTFELDKALEVDDKVTIAGKEYTIGEKPVAEYTNADAVTGQLAAGYTVVRSGGDILLTDGQSNTTDYDKIALKKGDIVKDADGKVIATIDTDPGYTATAQAEIATAIKDSVPGSKVTIGTNDYIIGATTNEEDGIYTPADIISKLEHGAEVTITGPTPAAPTTYNLDNCTPDGIEVAIAAATDSGTTIELTNDTGAQFTYTVGDADPTEKNAFDAALSTAKNTYAGASTKKYTVTITPPPATVTKFTNINAASEGTITATEAYKKMVEALKAASSIGTDEGSEAQVTSLGNGKFTIEQGSVKVKEALNFNLHVGADADMTNKITVEMETMNAANLGIKDISVAGDTGANATYAIDAIADAISKVSAQRSALGAIQNRLEHTIANLDNVVENTTAAESRIRDTDMAEEMVNYSKNNILAQAGQSMLAQANQSTQGVLSLLG